MVEYLPQNPNYPDELVLLDLIRVYELALVKAFNTTNFNWTCLMNASYRQEKEYLHIHCWPRYKQTVEFAGETFNDEMFAHHYDEEREKFVSEEVLNKIGWEIKKYLV